MIDDPADSSTESASPEGPPSSAADIKISLSPSRRPKWNEPDFNPSLRAAEALMAQKAFEDAVQRLDAAYATAIADVPGPAGPGTGQMFLQRGICRFELGELDTAERLFLEGADLAQTIDNAELAGIFLHELSMVAGRRGQHGQELRLSRDALIVKLKYFIAQGTPRGSFGKPRPRREPFEAISRLAFLLMQGQRWEDAKYIYVMLRDSCEARNDLARLARTHVVLAFLDSCLGRLAEMRHAANRAVWSGVICGLDVTGLLLEHGIKIAPPAPGEPPLLSDARGRHESESNLIAQYRDIALGLVADKLLRDGDMPTRAWWHQFASLRRPGPPFLERDDDPEFLLFQDDISAAVASRRIARIRPTDLMKRQVTINGGQIFWWQEGTINRHFAELGSSLRLFVVGTDVARAAVILELLGGAPAEPIIPSYFILGDVRTMTALGKANLFYFTREYAVSPYVNPDSPGFHDCGRIGLRQVILGHCGEFPFGTDAAATYRETVYSPDNEPAMFEGMMITFALGHELAECLQQFPTGRANFESWRAIIRDDICRFTQTPRTRGEILTAFWRTFDESNGLLLHMFPPGESPIDQPLTRIVDDLRDENLLRELPDGRLHFRGYITA